MSFQKLGALLCAGMLMLSAGCKDRSASTLAQADEQQDSAAASDTLRQTPEFRDALELFLQDGSDESYVTSHIDFGLPRGLSFLHPPQDASTASYDYYITGTSDPALELTLNGELIENRGENGSFAVMKTLEDGENVFTIAQDGDEKSVTITRSDSSYALTDAITRAAPQINLSLRSGSAYTLECVAPSGSSVTANIGGEAIPLKQLSPTALPDIPATFAASYEIPEAAGTVLLGSVTYTLTHNGKQSNYTSEGALYATGKNDALSVRIVNEASTVFTDPSYSSILCTARRGATDLVVETGNDDAGTPMYKLRMGGWVQAAAVEPVTEKLPEQNVVTASSLEVSGTSEVFTFSGSMAAFCDLNVSGSGLELTLFNTTGISGIDITDSKIFSAADAAESGGNITVSLEAEPGALWGAIVEYDGADTRLVCKPAPKLADGPQPLTGVTVAIDAGHGGSDIGTQGIAYDSFPVEKDITSAYALALQKKLALLGADTVMVRVDDENPSMNERMRRSLDANADFYISLHVNSAGYSEQAIAANGVEVYYFEDSSEKLAEAVCAGISANTGRYNRGAKREGYRVTMNSLTPSILAEMGFIPNPSDFDSLCSADGVYGAVSAVSDAIIASLTPGGSAGGGTDAEPDGSALVAGSGTDDAAAL